MPMNKKDDLEDALQAFARSTFPFQAFGTVVSGVSLLAVIHTQIQKIFAQQTRLIVSGYLVLAVVFCWSLLSSVWFIVWPLSGAQRLVNGVADKQSEEVACAALAMFGPVRLLNTLLTSVLVLFVPIVMVPPQQGRLASGRARLPMWCYVWLVRMYGVVFAAQIANCWYVYEFFQLNLGMLAALNAQANEVSNAHIQLSKLWIEGRLGVSLNTTALEAFAKHDEINDLTPLSAMALYLVVLWCALIVTYERLTHRSFREDFPRSFVLVLFPSLKHFEPVAGRLARFYNQGEETVVAFAEKVTAAQALLVGARAVLADATGQVRRLLQEWKEMVGQQASACELGSRAVELVESLEDRAEALREEMLARINISLRWGESELHYFANLNSLFNEGIDGELCEARAEGSDELFLGDGLLETLRELVHEAIDGALDAVEAMATPHGSGTTGTPTVEQFVGGRGAGALWVDILKRIDGVAYYVLPGLEAVERRCAVFLASLERTSHSLKDFVSKDKGIVVSAWRDQVWFVHEADQLVHIVSSMAFQGSECYPLVYRALFLILTIVSYAFKVMTFSMILVFWSRWTNMVRMVIIAVLSLFGVLVAFNNVFFWEAAAGRLGSVAPRFAPRGLELAVGEDLDPEAACHLQALPLVGGAVKRRRSFGLRRRLLRSELYAVGVGAQQSSHKHWALHLVVVLPFGALMLTLMGAQAVRHISGIDASVCKDPF